MSDFKVSWSSLSSYLSCPQKYDWAYNYGLEKIAGEEAAPRILGTLVHAGIRKALDFSYHQGSKEYETEAVVAAGRYGVIACWAQEFNKGVRSDTVSLVDAEYWAMIQRLKEQALEIVSYQIPLMEIGIRWAVASEDDVFHNGSLEPMLEYEIRHKVSQFVQVTGKIDAVLRDLNTGELYMVDYKVRQIFYDETSIIMDGQLPFYAMIVHQMGGETIRATYQWQISTHTPKAAEFTQKNLPSIQAISSTWAVWSESVRARGVDPEPYKKEMTEPNEKGKIKLHEDSHYFNQVYRPVTASVRTAMYKNLDTFLQVMEKVQGLDDAYPAVWSATVCRFCDFKALCIAKMTGGNIRTVAEDQYTERLDKQRESLVYSEDE